MDCATLFSVGNYDTVHGWNLNYQDTDSNPNLEQFHAFNMSNQDRPVQFHNLPISIIPAPPEGLLDHQGHIVPQNVLNLVLKPAMNSAFAENARPSTVAELNTYLNLKFANVNWTLVTAYVDWLIANDEKCNEGYFVDTSDDEGSAEDWYGGYFSVVMWNPVNICRAPGDGHRGGAPGYTIDTAVKQFLLDNEAQPGIALLPEMQAAFNDLPLAPTQANIVQFISACNSTLLHQQGGVAGYYMFDWHYNDAHALVPGSE